MHRVELAPRARRELQRALESGPDRQDGRRGPAASPSRPERLKGPLYRLRAGRYRIVYAVLDREQLVVALKVARRDEDRPAPAVGAPLAAPSSLPP